MLGGAELLRSRHGFWRQSAGAGCLAREADADLRQAGRGDRKTALDTLRACRAMPGDFEQFLALAGTLDTPRASEFERQLVWELALGENAPSRTAR